MKQQSNIFFIFLLLLSGFAGISYEILYGRILGNMIGNQWAVSASILLTFLLGIGLGTLAAHRLWRYLWLIEAGIGLYAACFALGFEFIEGLLYSGMDIFGHGLAGNITGCVLLLSFPSFLVGCSLPLFAGYLGRMSEERSFARAYAVHSLGAVLTVLLVEFALIRITGLRNAILTVAGVNAFASLSLFIRYRDVSTDVPSGTHYIHYPGNHIWALAVAGIASAVFQLWMLKAAELLMGPTRDTFALVLSVVLAGIAAGSALVKKYRLSFSHLITANLAGILMLAAGFESMAETYASLYPAAAEHYFLLVLLKLAILFLLMGIPAVTFGATVPSLMTAEDNVALESGRLLFVVSIANAAGFLLMVFVIHQLMSFGQSMVLIAAVSCLALFIHSGKITGTVAAGLIILAGVFASWGMAWNERLLYVGYTAFRSAEDLKANRDLLKSFESFKGRKDVFALTEMKNGDLFFFINGYKSMNLRSPSEKIVGAFSALLSPRTDQALVLGTGSGITAGTVGLLFDHTDTVEINPVVLQNLYRMKEYNFDIEKMAGVRIIQDDAVHFARTGSGSYSLIINTVTSPVYFSSSKLYTRDFIETVKQRMTPDGVYVTWVDTRTGDRGVDIILRTLSQSFRTCWLGYIRSKYFLFACSQGEITMHSPEIVLHNERLREDLILNGGVRTAWLPYHLLSTDALSLIRDRSLPVNTLDFPILEFEVSMLKVDGLDEFIGRLTRSMSIQEVQAALAPVTGSDPLALGLQSSHILGKSPVTAQWHLLLQRELYDFDNRLIEAQLMHYSDIAERHKNAGGHRDLGFEMLTMGRYPDAADQFRKALALDPEIDNANLYLADSYTEIGAFDQAIIHYQKALSLDPDESYAHIGIGRIHMKQQKYKAALEAFDRAAAISATSDANFYRGLAFERLGDKSSARSSYEEALRISPDDTEARNALLRLQGPR